MVSKEFDTAERAVVGKSELDLTGQTPVLMPLLDAGKVFSIRAGAYLKWFKPAIDRIVGLMALILTAPLLLVIAMMVWVAMDSPIFIGQERIGLRGRVFRL